MSNCVEMYGRITCGKCSKTYGLNGNSEWALPGSPYKRVGICPFCGATCGVQWDIPKLDLPLPNAEQIASWIEKKRKPPRPAL